MPYSLNDKIVQYLAKNGIKDARIADAVIIIPTETGELHRRISGVITAQKLDLLIADVKQSLENMV